jgi:Flp pilus assembly protein TadG
MKVTVMNTRNFPGRKKGTILVFSAVLMVMMFVFLAFAVDLGYLAVVRTQLQRTADSAAIAASWSLLDGEINAGQTNSPSAVSNALTTASQYSQLNKVLDNQPMLAESDVVVGYLSNPSNPNAELDVSGQSYNAVQVRVQRTMDQNGAVPLFFARVLGFDQQGSRAQATAAFLNNITGFRIPDDGSTLEILPFALSEQAWDALMAGQGTDNWTYDPDTETVSRGGDGIKEVNLYPQSTDSPGNSGTIDIGNTSNSTTDISRQIVHGISAQDLMYLGGEFIIPRSINGDTGISAGIKNDLMEIKGQPRVLPLYRDVYNPGNNAQFDLVRLVGVRVMDVKLSASMHIKHVTVQPATVIIKGAIPSTSEQRSNLIFSKVWLVR